MARRPGGLPHERVCWRPARRFVGVQPRPHGFRRSSAVRAARVADGVRARHRLAVAERCASRTDRQAERAALRRALPRRSRLPRDLPADRPAVRHRSRESCRPAHRGRARDHGVLGFPAPGQRRPAARPRQRTERRSKTRAV